MSSRPAAPTPRVADSLLSWDRLGFRLLFFGGLALLWIVNGTAMGYPWPELVQGELAGIMPWAFLAPIVFSWSRRFRAERLGRPLSVVAHLVGMVVVFVPYWFIQRAVLFAWACGTSGWDPSRLSLWVPTRQNVVGNFVNVPLVYLLVLLAAEVTRHAEARRAEQAQAGRLAGQLSEARFALLQRQLHPHFLFNALQAISTLLHRDPDTADRLLLRLSALLRAMIEDASRQTLDLRLELELTRQYLEIEQVRFEDRLRVEWDVDNSLLDVQVPSLVVLPLVENAVRHGLSPKVGPGRLRVGATAAAGSLVLTVDDDGLGATMPLRAGVGIANTRDRLAVLYGDRASLAVETAPERGFRARVVIPRAGARP